MKVMRNLPRKNSYAKHVEKLGDDLYAVEHYRYGKNNVAIVVLQSGKYFIGVSRTNPIDNYSRKRGHEISVGRALSAAVSHPGDWDGQLWEGGEETGLVGRDLGKACQEIADAEKKAFDISWLFGEK